MEQFIISQFTEIASFVLSAYAKSWPYLLLTIPLAVLINLSGISRYLEKAFTARPLTAIFLAALVGAFSPFCSCGVIPVITSLLIGGVPLAPVMSFWLASPSMDPEIFFLSVSRIGWDLAVWRLAATFVMSLAGGYAAWFLGNRGWIGSFSLKKSVEKASSCCSSEPVSQDLQEEKTVLRPAPSFRVAPENVSCCSSSASGGTCAPALALPARKALINPELLKDIYGESKKMVILILKFMTLAYVLEALIILYLPEAWIVSLLGSGNRLAIPLATAVGIPLYTTNLTALGLVGGLLQQGMSPGAALSFLISGATTTIPAMAAVYGIVKGRVFALYLLSTLIISLLAGYAYQLVYNL